MRRAKQKRADDVRAQAQSMVSDRTTQAARDYNSRTQDGVIRALEANRELSKSIALDSSILGRQGKAIQSQNESRAKPQNYQHPQRQTHVVDRNIVGKRKEQTKPDHGGESIPPGYKRVSDRDSLKSRNDSQPRFHPTEGRIVQTAYGVTQNPSLDRRRQQHLEERIRAAARK